MKALIVGGSRGLGRGVAEALHAHGDEVTTLARTASAAPFTHFQADAAADGVAARVLAELQPELVIVAAGAVPPMAPIDQMRWADFSATWNTDVKLALAWVQAAKALPKGSRMILTSSGAVRGSPLSGGYGGAKHMVLLLARYANTLQSGVRFQVVSPLQMVAGTGVGDAGSGAYARAKGITAAAFLAGYGAPLTARQVGEHVATIVHAPRTETSFGVSGDDGLTVLDD